MSGIIGQGIALPPNYGKGITLSSTPIGNNTPLKTAPACVPFLIDWSKYGASSLNPVTIRIDLAIMGPANPLDKIRSVYIDNTFSVTPAYIFFPDTQFTVVCPPNAICMSPVFTNGLQAFVYATGFTDGSIPQTTFTLSNVPEHGYQIASGITIPTPPPSVSYLQFASLIGGGVTQTYPAQNLGTPGPSRLIILVTYGLSTAALNMTTTGVTLAGTPMTLVTRQSINSTGSTSLDVAIWQLALAAGSTAIPIVTYSSAPTDNGIDIFSAYNLANNAVAHISGDKLAGSSRTLSAPLITGSPGIAIGANGGSVAGDTPLSGIQNIVTNAVVGILVTSHGQQSTGGLTLSLASITNGGTGVGVAALVGANWQ